MTSTGTDGSSALVWVVYVSGGTGADAELRAYRAIPDNTGHLKQVFSAPLGIAAKFSSVATDNGRVYVGTRDGHVLGFGAPTTSAVGATNTDLGTAAVGATSDRQRDDHGVAGGDGQLHHGRGPVRDRNYDSRCPRRWPRAAA